MASNKEEKEDFLETNVIVKPKESAEKKWKVAAVLMMIINLILLASILAVTISWLNERVTESIYMKQEPSMCLKCEDVYSHPDDMKADQEGFEKRMEENITMCCGHASKHLNKLVTLYTEKAHMKERNLKNLLYNPYKCKEGPEVQKPSSHLVGVTTSMQDMHEHHLLKWNQTCNLSSINGVDYKEGKIHITASGFYYIYSQITYQDNRDSFKYSDNDIVLHHSIHKEYRGIGDTRREKLLESSQSRCEIIGDKSSKTSYLGAVFYMKQNESVHVRVSHPPKLLLSKYSNYFGLYLT